MDLNLKVWRQDGPDAQGRFETYEMRDVSPEMSFLELFDILNDQLNAQGVEPVAFDHDCREGICGSCAMMIDGRAHGPETGTATCQLHLRKLRDGATITVSTDSDVTKWAMIRMGTATHTVDTDQRRLSLTPTTVTGGYSLTIPSDTGVAVPGYWMLFAMNAKGVPSVAKVIKIG